MGSVPLRRGAFGKRKPGKRPHAWVSTRWNSGTNPTALFGLGLIDPVDDLDTEGDPALSALLSEIAADFRDHRYDQKSLLRALMAARGRVLSREELIQEVWGDDFMGDPKTLDVHIRWLRAKIEADPGETKQIVTVRGVGFRFD